MSLPLPDLDDRTFEELLEEAKRQIVRGAPEWTDLSPGDPGMVLLELFAHLTETMIYRLNRLPEKAYIAFLRLLGVSLFPPSAASAVLHFSRGRAAEQALEIPEGTRVTVGRAGGDREPPVFITDETVQIPANETDVSVIAHHCELVEGELVGVGTGLPGLTVSVSRPPLIAPSGHPLDLVVGIEASADELDRRVQARQHGTRAYRIWQEVENFTNIGADTHIYKVDRMAGTILFAPAARIRPTDGSGLEATPRALAAVPQAGREIRVWYRRGGGPDGNVAAGTLSNLKDPIPGVTVTNPQPATGGEAGETLDNALTRGPQELHSLQRAISARDFEQLALQSARGGLGRAVALTSKDIWTHAKAGTVEVQLVPDVPGAGERLSIDTLRDHESEVIRERVARELERRRPLGTTCLVHWAHYKPVSVHARVVVGRQENQTAVQQRVLERLYKTINPLPTDLNNTGWPFGRALRASDVYSIALAEPGVRWVDQVRFVVDEVPAGQIETVATDHFQPQTWYAGSGDTLFRSLNDGAGWEPAGSFPDAPIHLVKPSPIQAGHVALVLREGESNASRLLLSTDCGESWRLAHQFEMRVEDIAWLRRGSTTLLMLATDQGLFELGLGGEEVPFQREVDPDAVNRGLYAVAAVEEAQGVVTVAVAAESEEGVFLSNDGGQTFRLIGLEGQDVRRLAVQQEGGRAFLWAGVFAAGGDTGDGCFRWELTGREAPPEGWRPYAGGWQGGSCRYLAFLGGTVVAGTHRAGVLRLDMAQREPAWRSLELESGLPLREAERLFEPINGVATRPGGSLILAATNEGLFRSTDGGQQYHTASASEFAERLTLPDNWLFVSGEHQIALVSEDEAE